MHKLCVLGSLTMCLCSSSLTSPSAPRLFELIELSNLKHLLFFLKIFSSPSECFPALSRAITCSDYALQEINMLLAFTGIIILRLYHWYVFILLTSAQNSQHPSTANREWPCCPWSGSVQWMLTPGLLLDRFHFPFYFVLTSFHPWKLHFSWSWMNELGSLVCCCCGSSSVLLPK